MNLPPDFGYPSCRWPMELDADPVEVRALYMQHRIVLAARGYMGVAATPREFAQALGSTERKDLTRVRRKLQGLSPLSLHEVADWSDRFEVDLSTITGARATDPEAYPPLYRDVIRVEGGRVRFRSRSVVDWAALTPHLHSQLNRQVERSAAELMGDEVCRLGLYDSLVGTGFDQALIRVETDGLQLLTRSPISVRCRSASVDDDLAWSRSLDAIGIAETGSVLVLILGATARARLELACPGLLGTAVGETYEVPTAAYEELAATADLFGQSWRVLGVSGLDTILTVAVLQTKD